jgi:hypothetical protein
VKAWTVRSLRDVVVASLVAAGCGSTPLTTGTLNRTDAATGAPTDVVPGGVVIASGQASPAAIAVQGAYVYWINRGTNATTDSKAPLGWTGGQVLKCDVAGCPASPILLASDVDQISNEATPPAFVVNGESVYWSDDSRSGIVTCGAAGCGGQPVQLAAGIAQGLAVFEGTFYWTEFTADLFVCSLAGCGSSQPTLWAAGYTPAALGVAVDASGVYWIAQAPDTLFTCPQGGCGGSPTVLMAGSNVVADSRQLALDADNVYFTDGNPGIGMILACPKSGCGANPTVLASGLDAPVAIATDGINVYWTETGSNFTAAGPVTGAGLVRKCAVGGCGNSPTTLASGLDDPGGIALDDTDVYWTEAGAGASTATGRIWKAPK